MYKTVCTGGESVGLRKSELISWYLAEMEEEIDSEAELMEKKTIAEKVVERLVHHVSGNISWKPFTKVGGGSVRSLYSEQEHFLHFLAKRHNKALFIILFSGNQEKRECS